MGSPLNVDFSLAAAATKTIIMNRWAAPNITVQIAGAGTALVEGTLEQLNRGDTAVWNTLIDDQGTTLTSVTGFHTINTPVEAIRITGVGNTITGKVMQQGASNV